jgi:uncharacterized membrane protein YgdD (TMEM256/DUF423 family)
MNTFFAVAACLLGALSVALGAFGSHGLRRRASLELIATFETGVRYQLYHSLALLILSIFSSIQAQSSLQVLAGCLFIIGILLFSGSLYLLVLTGKRRLGAITPLGGLALLAGWLVFAASFLFM